MLPLEKQEPPESHLKSVFRTPTSSSTSNTAENGKSYGKPLRGLLTQVLYLPAHVIGRVIREDAGKMDICLQGINLGICPTEIDLGQYSKHQEKRHVTLGHA